MKIKHPLFRQLDRERLLGSLAAREALYPMHLYAITKTFPTHDLHSPAVDGTEHTKMSNLSFASDRPPASLETWLQCPGLRLDTTTWKMRRQP